MAKETKKNKKIKIIPLCIFIGIILVVGLIYYFVSMIPIKNIYIKGNSYLTDQEIIELAKIENYPSFIKTSTSKVKTRILKNPYIKKVTVEKKMLAKIYIKVEEKKLLYRDEETNSVILEDKTKVNNNDYILPILLNYIPDTKYDNFIKKMNAIDDDIMKMISEILYDPNEQDDDRFLLHMNDGNDVYLTLTRFKQINYYKDVLEQLEGKKGILYLDSGNHFQIMN